MPRTKGSKNRPKTIHTDYASQIAEKQESITSLTAEILVLCQDLAQNKMRSSATKLLTENRPSHTFFQSR